MKCTLERVARRDAPELRWMVTHAIETVLTTVPDFRGDIERAVAVFPNLTDRGMLEMFRSVVESPTYYFMIAKDVEGSLVGHSIFSLKTDSSNVRYGFFYTRFVIPQYRRQGIGSKMLQAAEAWFASKGVAYFLAQTHVTNQALQGLFKINGYRIAEVAGSVLPIVELRKELSSSSY